MGEEVKQWGVLEVTKKTVGLFRPVKLPAYYVIQQYYVMLYYSRICSSNQENFIIWT